MPRGAKAAKAKVLKPTPRGAKPRQREPERAAASSPKARLERALEQQAATSEILRVISASPTEIRPVLRAVAERAAVLCKARFARVLLVEGDVLMPYAEYSAERGEPVAVTAVPLRRTSITGRAALERKTLHVADIVPLLDSEFPDARENASRTGFRAVLAVPLIREGNAYGAIFLWRRETGLFSPDQVALVETFAQQVAIAIDNVRLFKATKEALEQQTATSNVLKVISSSTFDLQPVLDTVVESAARLCGAEHAHVHRYDGKLLRLAAGFSAVPAMLDYLRDNPLPLGPGTISGLAGLERRAIHWHDVLQQSGYKRWEAQRIAGFRTMLAVPMLAGEELLGVLVIWKTRVEPFSDKQIELVTTFADQAVIAIQNVRLFTELQARNRDITEALEQQTATSEILRVISRSPTDAQPAFETIVDAAMKLCNATSANLFTYDGSLVHLVAFRNVNAEYVEQMRRSYPRPPGRESGICRAVMSRGVVTIPDVLADPDYDPAIATLAATSSFRSVLAVPLMREGNPIGGIAIGRSETGQFPERQVALLQTFADQAVIAIENVRLFRELEARNRELTEALEQQTATSEILRVISRSPTDVQPVFDTIAAATLKLCAADTTIVATFDGELIHVGALANVDPGGADAIRHVFPRPPSHDNATARAVLTRSVVLIPDVLEDPLYAVKDLALTAGFRSILAVPLLRNGNPIGAITVGRPQPGLYTESQVALLQTFADQAVIAIENVRLFMELQTRTTELTQSVRELKALGEVGQAVSSTLDLETVLSTIVSRATQLAGVDGGALYEYVEERDEFYLHTVDRYPRELVEALRSRPVRKGDGAVGRLAVVAEPIEIRDIADEKIYQSSVRKILMKLGYRSLLAVPLLREDHLLGGLVVNRKSAGRFSPQVIDLLKTFAAQSALAIQNARLFREIESKSRELEAASRHKSEFLANMSHELRTPLNAIIGFSEVLNERMFGEINDKQAEYLADILESGRHLLSLINDILDLSKIEAGRMEIDATEFSLPAAIDNTLTLVRERAHRRAIQLERTIEESVGNVCADERKVKQVVLNLLSNALKFTPEGGRVAVRARTCDRWAEVSVSDTGVGIAPEDQETVFDEFRQVGAAAKKIEGTGLGLAISRKFIELHGGRIWVTSTPGAGATFTFTLPSKGATDAPA